MVERPKAIIELEPGDYIVSVHPAYAPRVWRHEGAGVFRGHGGKIRRPTIAEAIHELTRAAEDDEGIGRSQSYEGRLFTEDGTLIRPVTYTLDGGFGELAPVAEGDERRAFILELKRGQRLAIQGTRLRSYRREETSVIYNATDGTSRQETSSHDVPTLGFKITGEVKRGDAPF